MASDLSVQQRNELPSWLLEWWPILLGLAVLYVPTYYALSSGIWVNEDQAYGPIVVLVVLYLIWQQRHLLISPATVQNAARHNISPFSQGKEQGQPALRKKTSPILGWTILSIGLLCYLIGRSQDIFMFDVGSQILVLAGVLLVMRGMPTLLAMWFPLFFIIFMIPLPGFVLDAVTLPMKIAVSYVAENILYWLDYPIARSGVTLQIGQYQLLVADACAGMHTLISLEAMGLLYLNVVKHDSWFRNVTLATLIIPISFTANVIRVIVLTLITYYLGDEIGQGFVHKFAGMVLFLVALTLIISVDSALQYGAKLERKDKKNGTAGIRR